MHEATRGEASVLPLIELRGISRSYRMGDGEVTALADVSLEIARGEFVAITGASGSGKTTLLNILGCLDKPTSGSYRLEGLEVGLLSSEELSGLRAARIGFVFQTFNLMSRSSALENVRMPTVYRRGPPDGHGTEQRCRELLARLGLGSRLDHPPAKLSGGEQQRVAIARALVNEPALLLADEPTGNLDSRTGREIMDVFRKLNAEAGLTVILITHDPAVAYHADRVVRLRDGRVVEDGPPPDRVRPVPRPLEEPAAPTPEEPERRSRSLSGTVGIAAAVLRRNLMRTLLTILGVVIGVGAVIAMMEMSQGASVAIRATVASLGANTLLVLSGPPQRGSSRFGEATETLTPGDAEAIVRECPDVVTAAPIVNAVSRVIHGNRSWNPIYLVGSTPAFLEARNWEELDLGRSFSEREVEAGAQVCLLGQTLVSELFEGRSPIGQEVRVRGVPFQVIGTLGRKGANLLGVDQDDILLAPWTTLKYRVGGSGGRGGAAVETTRALPGTPPSARLPGKNRRTRSAFIPQVIVKARSAESVPATMESITRVLQERHHLVGEEYDFRIYDTAEVSEALKRIIGLLSSLGIAVALVGLLVGGVGIMNIMLVSVTERTREIGLRMAVGADRGDILHQFLIEAVVLCLAGGLAGIAAGRIGSAIAGRLLGWPVFPSIAAAVVAVAVSVIVGITFGYYPAWRASRLNPIDALRYE